MQRCNVTQGTRVAVQCNVMLSHTQALQCVNCHTHRLHVQRCNVTQGTPVAVQCNVMLSHTHKRYSASTVTHTQATRAAVQCNTGYTCSSAVQCNAVTHTQALQCVNCHTHRLHVQRCNVTQATRVAVQRNAVTHGCHATRLHQKRNIT